jgi:hypothetical protein
MPSTAGVRAAELKDSKKECGWIIEPKLASFLCMSHTIQKDAPDAPQASLIEVTTRLWPRACYAIYPLTSSVNPKRSSVFISAGHRHQGCHRHRHSGIQHLSPALIFRYPICSGVCFLYYSDTGMTGRRTFRHSSIKIVVFIASAADSWHFGTDPDADSDPWIHTSD